MIPIQTFKSVERLSLGPEIMIFVYPSDLDSSNDDNISLASIASPESPLLFAGTKIPNRINAAGWTLELLVTVKDFPSPSADSGIASGKKYMFLLELSNLSTL